MRTVTRFEDTRIDREQKLAKEAKVPIAESISVMAIATQPWSNCYTHQSLEIRQCFLAPFCNSFG